MHRLIALFRREETKGTINVWVASSYVWLSYRCVRVVLVMVGIPLVLGVRIALISKLTINFIVFFTLIHFTCQYANDLASFFSPFSFICRKVYKICRRKRKQLVKQFLIWRYYLMIYFFRWVDIQLYNSVCECSCFHFVFISVAYLCRKEYESCKRENEKPVW